MYILSRDLKSAIVNDRKDIAAHFYCYLAKDSSTNLGHVTAEMVEPKLERFRALQDYFCDSSFLLSTKNLYKLLSTQLTLLEADRIDRVHDIEQIYLIKMITSILHDPSQSHVLNCSLSTAIFIGNERLIALMWRKMCTNTPIVDTVERIFSLFPLVEVKYADQLQEIETYFYRYIGKRISHKQRAYFDTFFTGPLAHLAKYVPLVWNLCVKFDYVNYADDTVIEWFDLNK